MIKSNKFQTSLYKIMQNSKDFVVRLLLFVIAYCFLGLSNANALVSWWDATVTESPNSSYFRPLVNINIERNGGLSGYTAQLGNGDCSFMGPVGVRVCARIEMPKGQLLPGDKGYDPNHPEKNAPGVNFGNDTGLQGNPRVRMCVFEDPMDGGDTNPDYEPYNHDENKKADIPESAAMTGFEGAAIGVGATAAVTGTIVAASAAGAAVGYTAAGIAAATMGPVGIVVAATILIAAGTMVLVAVLQEHHNHVVVGVLGCADVPISPLPPVWRNNAWKVTYYPDPDISISNDSGRIATFFDPYVKVRVCKDSSVTSGRDKIISCSDSKAVDISGSPFIINPNDQHQVPDPNHANAIPPITLFEDSVTVPDGRKFIANISVDNPKKVCVYKQLSSTGNRVLINCFPRPGWMPKPTIADGGYNNGQSLIVSYPSRTLNAPPVPIKLTENPGYAGNGITFVMGWTSDCNYLQQVRFCISRPCNDASITDTTCPQFKPEACISGYEVPNLMVVADTKTNNAIQGPPNQMSNSIGSYIYSPPQCMQKDNNGYCLNYNTSCLKYDATNTNCLIPLADGSGGQCCTAPPIAGGQSPNCPGVSGPYTGSGGTCLQYVRNVPTGQDIYWYNSSYINNSDGACDNASSNSAQNQVTSSHDCRPVNTLRPLTPEELGMCISTPDSRNTYIKNGKYSDVRCTSSSAGCTVSNNNQYVDASGNVVNKLKSEDIKNADSITITKTVSGTPTFFMGNFPSFPTTTTEKKYGNSYGNVTNDKYIVPPGCGKIVVRMWGGGATGRWTEGDGTSNRTAYAGGSGGYAKLELKVTPGQTLDLTIAGNAPPATGCGSGCSSIGYDGDNTSISYGGYNSAGFIRYTLSVPGGMMRGDISPISVKNVLTNSIWSDGNKCSTNLSSDATCKILEYKDGNTIGFINHGSRGLGGGLVPIKGCWNSAGGINNVFGVYIVNGGQMGYSCMKATENNYSISNLQGSGNIDSLLVPYSTYVDDYSIYCRSNGFNVKQRAEDQFLPDQPNGGLQFNGSVIDELLPNQPTSINGNTVNTSGTNPAPNPSDATLQAKTYIAKYDWPFAWPGAGACTDGGMGTNNYTMGSGGTGRIEIQCTSGTLSGGQANCASQQKKLKIYDPIAKQYRYFSCNLPSAKNGLDANTAVVTGSSGSSTTTSSNSCSIPNTACVEDNSLTPVASDPNLSEVFVRPCIDGSWSCLYYATPCLSTNPNFPINCVSSSDTKNSCLIGAMIPPNPVCTNGKWIY